MSRWPSCRIAFTLFVVSLAHSLNAQSAKPIEDGQKAFGDFEGRYAVDPPTPSQFPAQQAAFVGTTVAQLPPPAPQPAAAPSSPVAPTFIPPANGMSIYPPPTMPGGPALPGAVVESPFSDAWCLPPTEPSRTSSWTAAIETIITQADVNRFTFGAWPEDHDVAGRLILGYEDPSGLGLRLRLWSFSQSVAAFSTDVDLNASSADFDLYKRLFIDDTEIVLGGGGAAGTLEFRIPNDGLWKFNGGGVTMFAEGFQPLMRFPTVDIGMVGRARTTLLEGDWDDSTTYIGPSTFGVPAVTDHDTMSVTELACGLEFRRRFGKKLDHQWFAAVLLEHQRWQSDWMTIVSGSSVGFTGTNFSTGVSW